jgi:hypothetical protein
MHTCLRNQAAESRRRVLSSTTDHTSIPGDDFEDFDLLFSSTTNTSENDRSDDDETDDAGSDVGYDNYQALFEEVEQQYENLAVHDDQDHTQQTAAHEAVDAQPYHVMGSAGAGQYIQQLKDILEKDVLDVVSGYSRPYPCQLFSNQDPTTATY